MAESMRTHTWWASGILGALLVGCTTGAGPTPAAPMTTSASRPGPTSATTTSTSEALTSATGSSATGGIPAAAQVDSVDGSVEFVRFLVAEVNRAYRTPNAAVLDPQITSGCLGCQDLRRHIASMESLGQRTISDTWVATLVVPTTWSPGNATVVLRIQQNRVDFVDSQGRQVDYMIDGNYEYFLTLHFDAGWRVTRWQKT